MSETRDLLERAGEGFEFPDDAFDRLLGRRERKLRNRRVASGVLAFVVSVLAIAGLIRAFAAPPDTGDRTVSPSPALSRRLEYNDNGFTVFARGEDHGYSWILSDQHMDPRTDHGPYLVIEGPLGLPILEEPNTWNIGCLDRVAYLAAATGPEVERVWVQVRGGAAIDARWMPTRDRRGRPVRIWLAFLPRSGTGVVRIGQELEESTSWPVSQEITRASARSGCASRPA